ncbi:MAG TPA: class I SAM-dependent methyltransferase [Vicinamibacterales bacterium]|jgi:SAM-dependent methyltransferase|nr:class I SAM-dependent methyltransferase [Vicinamibacterales bacterium]
MNVLTALSDTQHAFDGVAKDYDRSNARNRTICAMRERLWETVDRHVPAGSSLLDLGCGPGADVDRFAASGYRVTGVDWSPAMVQEARQRLRRREAAADVRHLGIHELDRLSPSTFDAAYSDLGPLNCVPDLPAAARLIADRLRPGGLLIASVISRVCPWEIALYLARGDWPRARIRFSGAMTAVPLEGRTVWTRYYTPAEFETAFAAAGFGRVSLRTLGLFVPPPYLQPFADRHPSLVAGLQRIEDAVGAWPGVRNWGDHFLMVLRRT